MITWRRSTVLPTHIMFTDDSPATHAVVVTGRIDTRPTTHYHGTLAACEREIAKRNQMNASIFLTREILPI